MTDYLRQPTRRRYLAPLLYCVTGASGWSPETLMRIPSDAIIAEAKLTDYLLVRRPWDDKSGFLRSAGFGLENWHELRGAIRQLADAVDAVVDGDSEYGTFYQVEGQLVGPTGTLQVVCIWMRRAIENRFHFVTLKPSKKRSGDVPPAL